jgi:hypothetical protein
MMKECITVLNSFNRRDNRNGQAKTAHFWVEVHYLKDACVVHCNPIQSCDVLERDS